MGQSREASKRRNRPSSTVVARIFIRADVTAIRGTRRCPATSDSSITKTISEQQLMSSSTDEGELSVYLDDFAHQIPMWPLSVLQPCSHLPRNLKPEARDGLHPGRGDEDSRRLYERSKGCGFAGQLAIH